MLFLPHRLFRENNLPVCLRVRVLRASPIHPQIAHGFSGISVRERVLHRSILEMSGLERGDGMSQDKTSEYMYPEPDTFTAVAEKRRT